MLDLSQRGQERSRNIIRTGQVHDRRGDPLAEFNHAPRFGVLWRKRSQGTCSEQGNHWVERVLSLRHTCRIRGRLTFPVLVEAVSCLFKGETPDLNWITYHKSLPACSPP